MAIKKTTASKKSSTTASTKKAEHTAATPAPAPSAAKPKIETYEARMRKLAPQQQIAHKMSQTLLRWSNMAKIMGAWKNVPQLAPLCTKVHALLDEINDEVVALGKDFVPEKGRKERESKVKPGARVSIRERVATTYDGVIDGEDRTGMEVLDVRKGRLVCRTASGEKVMIPRGHVVPTTTPDTKTEAA